MAAHTDLDGRSSTDRSDVQGACAQNITVALRRMAAEALKLLASLSVLIILISAQRSSCDGRPTGAYGEVTARSIMNMKSVFGKAELHFFAGEGEGKEAEKMREGRLALSATGTLVIKMPASTAGNRRAGGDNDCDVLRHIKVASVALGGGRSSTDRSDVQGACAQNITVAQ